MIRVTLFLFISIIMLTFVIPNSMKLLDASDKELEKVLGPASKILAWAVPEKNIPDRVISAGTFIETEFVPGGILTPDKSKVNTTEGIFIVIGPVSAFKGQRVKISGLSDGRLEKQLVIGSKKYTLSDVPEV